jgi:hypothetical protein
VSTKICNKCNIEKDISNFCKDISKKDGLCTICKLCSKQKHNIYYQEHKEELCLLNKIKRITNNKYINNREQLLRKKYPERSILKSIIQRCYNPNNKAYKNYGGKGIKKFLTTKNIKYMMIRDNYFDLKKPSIDRLDSNGNYCIENCKFIELSENISKRNKENSNFYKLTKERRIENLKLELNKLKN